MSFLIVRFPFIAHKLYLGNDWGRRQRIKFRHASDELECILERPTSVMRGVTKMIAKGGSRSVEWPARFQGGIVSIQMFYKVPERSNSIWVSLWDEMDEEHEQLRLEPRDVDRFDFIG